MNLAINLTRLGVVGVVLVTLLCRPGNAQDDKSDTQPKNPIVLKLVPIDLSEASNLMIKYDRDDDGQIDRDEQRRLRWDEESIRRFDVLHRRIGGPITQGSLVSNPRSPHLFAAGRQRSEF